MRKENLILFPTILGLTLILYSWYASYPLSINSVTDFAYNHISPLYWIGLSIFISSLFAASILVKNQIVRLLICITIILSMFSLRFFYYSLYGSDMNYVRGLNEYLAMTGDLDPSKSQHSYYQWPFLFVLSKIA